MSAATEQPYRDPAPGTGVAKKKAPTLTQRAVYRWSAITTVMAVLLVLYSQHPYYKGAQFAPWRPFYFAAFLGWLALGIFYCKATLQKFDGMRYTMRDGGLHLLLLAKAWQEKRFWHFAKKPRIRTTLLGIGVKAFFTPLMTGFLAGHLNSVARAWLVRKHLPPLDIKIPAGTTTIQSVGIWWNHMTARAADFVPNLSDLVGLLTPWTWTRAELSWGLGFAYDLVFVVDCGWALAGYASESRWIGNKTRSVEPTAFGWAICLCCYPPFNNVLGTYLPLESGKLVTDWSLWAYGAGAALGFGITMLLTRRRPSLFMRVSFAIAGAIFGFGAAWAIRHWVTIPMGVGNDSVMLGFRAATIFLFAIYASATVAFGFKFSNLTNRGIVTRGPYRFVRHPAYLCKCAAWWLEHIPTLTIMKALFLSMLCGVYALRAWTEERHLSKDPDYVAYKKKVPWVLLPGVY